MISAGADLDPVTRSSPLVARVPESSGLVPGQMVTLTVTRPTKKGAVSVPSQSVAYIDGKPVVFLWTGIAFNVTPVSVLGKTVDVATVEGGLASGQEVAATGIADLEKMMAGN